MDTIAFLTIVGAFILGFLAQTFFRCSPRGSLGLSFLAVMLTPPLWGLGITIGWWVCCAFLTFHPEEEHRERCGLKRMMLYAFFTFSGFILTLLILWKVKYGYGVTPVLQREILAWVYLIGIEVCFYKIIAYTIPKWNRFQIGYGIGFLNTCMLLFWLLPYGYQIILLTLLTLMVINPLLLFWVDRPGREADGIF